MKKYFPSQDGNYRFLQANRGNNLGNLWSTFGVDFQTNPDTIMLGQKLVINISSNNDSALGRPLAFEYFDRRWWAICGSTIFRNSNESFTNTFQKDITSKFSVGGATTQFDVTNTAGSTYRYTYDTTGTNPEITAATFPVGALVTIDNTNLASGNEGDFTVTGSGANYFEVTNASGVVESNKTISTGYIAVYGGSLNQEFSENSDLAIFNGRLWCTTATRLYSKDAYNDPWILRDNLGSGAVHKMAYLKNFDRLYYIDTDTSVSSIDVADAVATTGDYHIDIGTSSGDFATTIVATSQEVFIGMSSQANSNVSASTRGKILQWDGVSNQGTQEYTLTSGGVISMLVKEGVVYVIDSSARILGFTGSAFKELGKFPITGQYLLRSTTSGESFVDKNGFIATDYGTFLIAINNRTDSFEDSFYENIAAGIWEYDISTGNLTHKHPFTYKSRASGVITDFGQNRVAEIGAIKFNTLTNDSSVGRSTILAGATYYTDGASTEVSAIFMDNPYNIDDVSEFEKKGYFVTTFYSSDDIADKWNKLWVTYKRFNTAENKIVFKYRLEDNYPLYADITWINNVSFTTTTDPSAYWTSGTGGEVEILQGKGSGSCPHIINITENAGTYTVTLDEIITGATGTAKARFQSWVKMLPEATGLLNSYEKFPIQEINTRIQIKCYMTFYRDNDEFHKFVLFSTNEIMATG